MYGKRVFIYFCFIIGLISMISGVYLVVGSFKHEVLDDKYIVKEVVEFKNEDNKLEKGQFKISKDVSYVSKGIYKLVYRVNYDHDNKNNLFAPKSNIIVTDAFGEGYKLDTDRVVLNNDIVKLYSYNTITSDYKMNYNNNTFEITFPKDKIFKYNTITLYVKLIGRDSNKKYLTSIESYYSFTPNANNDFYPKKTLQSYSIDGSGYIVLQNK